MKVFYDAQIFFLQKYGGISKYFSHLIKNFLEYPSLGIQPIFQMENLSNVHLRETLNQLENHALKHDFLLFNLLRNALKKPKNIAEVNLVHFTYYLPSKLLYNKNIKKISTIHDFIPETIYPFFSPNRYAHFVKNKYIKKSDGLIFVSNYTEQLANFKYANLETKKTSVIHHGVDRTQITSDMSPFFGRSYFLYVGNRDYYKNFSFLLKAFSKVAELNNLYLVCFGGPKYNKSESKLLRQYNLEDRIFFTNDKLVTLNSLYQNALALINPSLEEGFGMTNLEALSNDCLVLCSDIPVFREILGNQAIYFDPRSESSLINKIGQVISQSKNEGNLSPLRKKSFEFSWYETAKKTANFYKTIIS